MTTLLLNRHFQLGKTKGKLLLNLGCGGNVIPEFIGLDSAWFPGVDLCWDLRKGIPLSDNSLDGVYSEHTLEHIPYDALVSHVMPEIRRVLKNSGTLRIVVPDGEKFIDMYQRVRDGLPAWPDDTDLYGFTPMWHLNRVARYQGHQFLWDYETFAVVLRDAGFSDIRRCEYMEGRDARLLVDTERRKAESLYVEASL